MGTRNRMIPGEEEAHGTGLGCEGMLGRGHEGSGSCRSQATEKLVCWIAHTAAEVPAGMAEMGCRWGPKASARTVEEAGGSQVTAAKGAEPEDARCLGAWPAPGLGAASGRWEPSRRAMRRGLRQGLGFPG